MSNLPLYEEWKNSASIGKTRITSKRDAIIGDEETLERKEKCPRSITKIKGRITQAEGKIETKIK